METFGKMGDKSTNLPLVDFKIVMLNLLLLFLLQSNGLKLIELCDQSL